MVQRLETEWWECSGVIHTRCFPDDRGRYVTYHDYSALEARITELEKDAARYRKIRAGRCDNFGDCYAMSFNPDGDICVEGSDLDLLVDRMTVNEA